jgi:7-cyano-7-deazaguanine synthase
MLSLSAAYAISIGADQIFFGAHAGDHAIYPDCRQEFIDSLNATLDIGNYNAPEVIAPYINKTKSDIVKLGLELKVPYEQTWSCYNGLTNPCLKCGTCVERTEAFIQNLKHDPLLTNEEWSNAVQIYEIFSSKK